MEKLWCELCHRCLLPCITTTVRLPCGSVVCVGTRVGKEAACAASPTAGTGHTRGRFGVRPRMWRGRGRGAAWLGQAEVASFV